MIRKKRVVFIVVMLIVCLAVFSGCVASHNIPKGRYGATLIGNNVNNIYTFYDGNINLECYWQIKRNVAEYHVSGTMLKYDIVVEDEDVYLVENFSFDKEKTKTIKYKIIYDAGTTTITIFSL